MVLLSFGFLPRPLTLPYPALDYARVLANGGVPRRAAGPPSLSLRSSPLSLEPDLLLVLQRRLPTDGYKVDAFFRLYTGGQAQANQGEEVA